MSKETKSLLIILVTIAVNILAPILMRDMYKDYTKKSEIVGTPSNEVVINEHISVKDYVYQENLSKINFVQDESSGLYTYSYYFSPVDFDSTQNNYGVFINDYMCTLKNLQAKSISAEHIRHFNDISKEVINTITLDITFEFYTSYSYLLITLDTDDITYFNGFKENPGFVLTLSALNFANTYTEVEIPEDNSCLVEYVVDSATYSTVRLEQGSTLPNIPTAPTKDGYIFKGWSIDGSTVVDLTALTINEDTTIYALFNQIHTVRYMVAGNEYHSEQVEHGNKLTNIPSDPSIEGHTFIGWYYNDEKVKLTEDITSSMVLTAVFEEIKIYYTISIDESVSADNIEIKYYSVNDTTNKVTPGDSIEVGEEIYVWFNANLYSELIFTGATATQVDANNYHFTLTGNVTISAVEKEIEVTPTESVLTINGSYKSCRKGTTSVATGSVLTIGGKVGVEVYTYKTQSVTITGGTYTEKVYPAEYRVPEILYYSITVTEPALVIDIVEKEVYDQSTVVFNLSDYEAEGYSFKVYVYGSYDTKYDPRFDKFENARELSDGDKVDINKDVYVLVWKDGEPVYSSYADPTENTPLTGSYNQGVYSYSVDGNSSPRYYYMYKAFEDTTVIQ